jgi:uncharacterized protein YihD (DUF1040 family)
MRDPNRIDEIIDWLRQEWKANPDWRLGQLIVNQSPQKVRREARELFFLEDTYWTDKVNEAKTP